jgi:hypothetical protein
VKANPRVPRLDRREFLRIAGAGAGTLALAGPRALASTAPLAPRTRHVVLVAFAGGVRSRETIHSPENIPNLTRLAAEGVVFPETTVQNVGHYGAAMSIFTGRTEVFGIRENLRGPNPTIFEYARKHAGLSSTEVWLASTGGDQQVNYSFSTHPAYGPEYGANLVSGDGIFNPEFKSLLENFGRVEPPDPEREARLERLRAAIRPSAAAAAAAGPNDPDSVPRVARYLLEELASGTTRLTGPGAGDAKAIRVAANVMRIFRPRLLGISLGQADCAHGSYNDYVEVIRRNDAELGKLLDAIRADEELRDSTALFVLPEFGRDRDLNERRGLDHGDGSEDLLRVALIASGPDFRRGKIVSEAVASIDVCPTIGKILGARTEAARGKVLKGLFA